MRTTFGVIVFLAICGTCAEVGKQLYESHIERQQRIKREQEERFEEVVNQCRFMYPRAGLRFGLCVEGGQV